MSVRFPVFLFAALAGFLFLTPFLSRAATITWVATSTTSWNTSSSWSTGAVPTASDIALFSSSSTSQANVQANTSVGGIQINSTGTIALTSAVTSFTVGTSGFTQSGTSTFTSSGTAMTVNGPFTLNSGATFLSGGGAGLTVNDAFTLNSGATFTAPPSTYLTLTASATFAGGVFNSNSGTIAFESTSTTATVVGSTTFNNLQIGSGGAGNFILTVATGTVLTAQGSFYVNTNFSGVALFGGGEIDIQGIIAAQDAPRYTSSTVNLVMNGTGNQTIGDNNTVCGHGASSTCSALLLPNLTITKTSGSVTLANTIDVYGNWTNTNGTTIIPGSSTLAFGYENDIFSGSVLWPSAGTTITITGSSTFNNLAFGAEQGTSQSYTFTVATGTVLTAQGYFHVGTNNSSTAAFLGGGQINIQGDIAAQKRTNAATSTATFLMNGTGTQTIGTAAACATCNLVSLPYLTITKPSGLAVASSNNVVIAGALNLTQGEFRLSSSTTATTTVEVDGAFTVSSGATLSNYAQASSTFNLGSSMTNNGTLFFDGGGGGCGSTDYIIIRSTASGTQRTWSGTGSFVLEDVDMKDQSSTIPINVYSSTNSGGNGSNFSFVSCPTFTQTDYRLYQNATNTVNPSTALAAQDVIPTLTATSTPVRLLLNLVIGTSTVPTSTQAFKLQYGSNSTSSWTDVGASSTTSTAWVFYDNSALADQTAVTSTLLSTSNAGGSYAESNPIATNTAGFAVGQGVEWDFSLDPANTTMVNTYYFRMVKSDGTALDAYTNYPGVTVGQSAAPSASTPVTVGVGGGIGFSGFVLVTIQTPLPNAVLSGKVPLTAMTTDDSQVNMLYFTVDGIRVGTSGTRSPYTAMFDTAAFSPGFHVLQAFAQNNYGNVAASSPITFTVMGTSTSVSTGAGASSSRASPSAAAPSVATSSPSLTFFSRNLALWDTGNDVRQLQIFLNAHGYPVAPSGNGSLGRETLTFGLKTYRAIVKFQRDHHLPSTGFFGPMTREAVNGLIGK